MHYDETILSLKTGFGIADVAVRIVKTSTEYKYCFFFLTFSTWPYQSLETRAPH